MMVRFRWLACFSIGVLATTGCTSKAGPSAPAEDASSGSEDAGSVTDSGTGAVMEAAPAQMCAAVSLTPSADASMAECFACQASMCVQQLAACATDCVCGPSYQCLETHGNDYTMCPTAMSALFNTNAALTAVAACASAPAQCGGPCFGNDGG